MSFNDHTGTMLLRIEDKTDYLMQIMLVGEPHMLLNETKKVKASVEAFITHIEKLNLSFTPYEDRIKSINQQANRVMATAVAREHEAKPLWRKIIDIIGFIINLLASVVTLWASSRLSPYVSSPLQFSR